jgi:hypothetical protein
MHILISVSFHSPELKAIEKEVEVVLKFPEAEALSPPILQVNEVSFGYCPDKTIFNNVNLGATLESRICIVSFFLMFRLFFPHFLYFIILNVHKDRLCGLQIRRPRFDSWHYQEKKSSGSGTGSTQPREYN